VHDTDERRRLNIRKTECKPKDECPSAVPDNDVELLPGMVNVMNNQGCCPSFQAVCAPETCPAPKPCPAYHEKIPIDGRSCCPLFKCGECSRMGECPNDFVRTRQYRFHS